MEDQVVITKTEKKNSYEFGKASARHKVYYDEPKELKDHMDALRELGYIFDGE